MVLAKGIYKLAKLLPADEKYGLSSQIKRSVISIPSNIAEGCGRGTNKQLSLFIDYALGSTCELETQVLLVAELELTNSKSIKETLKDINEVRMMLIGFQKRIKKT